MSTGEKKQTLESLKSLLFLVVKISLKNGLTYREFTNLCKCLFVEVAAKDFGLQGRPTNVSRIALLTGLDRKEIKRIKDLLLENNDSDQSEKKQDRITRVISAWYQDPEFQTPSGKPRLLKRHGESQSFSSLVKRFGGDVPEGAMLKELLRVGVVEEANNGLIKIVKRTFIPNKSDSESLVRAVSVFRDIGSTLVHNIYGDCSKKDPLRFERRAHNRHIDPASLDEFKDFLEEEGQAFLERIDAWLSEHESKKGDDVIRLGVGTYLIKEEIQSEDKPDSPPEKAKSGPKRNFKKED